MTTHLQLVPGLVLATILTAGPTASAEKDEIHKCTDAQGNVTYQDDPCPEVPKVAARAPRAASAHSPAKPHPAPTRTGPPRVPAPLVVPPAPRRSQVQRAVRPARPVDPRYATPAGTWQTFVTAMRAGDRAAALACLTSGALRQFGPLVGSLPPNKLRETVDAFGGVASGGEVGPFWSLRTTRPAGRSKWIFLERTDDGAWKIAAM